ncbi:MAG: DUF4347 domain-containing protein [Candidatus Accumulibacter sp. UW20]|jgi:Ca2+-binding RTX toxin-like protein
MVKNFVFIDNRIGNYKTLVAGLSDDTVWVLLNADKDGIQQMMEHLSSYSNLDSIQLISHGNVGTLYVGSTVLKIGMDGDATLGGGLDSDTLAGGSGNDVYYVDDLYDVIYGYGSEGTDDTVYVSVNGYHLSTEIEHVVYISGAEPLPYFINTLFSGYSWGNIGQSQSLTYSFVTQATDGVTGFAAYSTEQQAYVRLALSKYSAVSGLQFTEAVDSPEVGLRYFRDDLSSLGLEDYSGYASYPPGGDVHIRTDLVDMSPDAYGFQLLLHETGHALGLKHPFEAPVLDPAEDYQANTVMTYNISYPFAQDIGLFDLASIHYLYSVNHTARSGDDTYRIGDRYIWDGAGNDTLSAMDQTLSVSINLHTGSWLYAGSRGSSLLASGQAFIGFGTELENATGGSGNDTISGNEASNSLIGGIGEDTLTGYAGNDTLDGSAGLDSMIGGDGSDIYYVDNIGDVVSETNAVASSGGIDQVNSYLTAYTLGANVENGRILATGTANLTGNRLDNLFYAGVGDNLFDGSKGSDTVSYAYGVAGTTGVSVNLYKATAQATGGSGSDTLVMSIEHLIGSAYADKLTGNSGANRLTGNDGNDTLDGATGIDTMTGGDGSDTYYVRDIGDLVSETNAVASSGGIDQVNSYLTAYTLGANVENGRILATGPAALTGNTLDNLLYAGVGDNLLYGSSGIDTVSYAYGVTGATGVSVNLSRTTAQTTGGSGSDTLLSIEKLIGSAYADKLIGSTGANRLTGNDGNDTLDGGTGIDTMTGGDGSDTYYVRDIGDIVSETNVVASSGGIDHVNSDLTAYTLGANVENGRILATGTAALTGNTLDNLLYAGVGDNLLDGSSGTDTVSYAYGVAGTTGVSVNLSRTTAQATGGSGSDTLLSIEKLIGSAYADKLIGSTGANRLTGNDGNDTLDGGAGIDTMTGGDGSDTYYVRDIGDIVSETNAVASSGGIDHVNSDLAAYTLGANVENGRILATGPAALTGNTLDNLLYAGVGDNLLDGSSGTDTVSYAYGVAGTTGVSVNLSRTTAQTTGGSGSDTLLSIEKLIGSAYADKLIGNTGANRLTGNDGRDTLDGGAGIDTMSGGDGSDTYHVRDIGDLVSETNAVASSGGIDHVNSYLTAYTLGANVENGRILATGTATLSGNTLNNVLYAGVGDNLLDGVSGIDTVSYKHATASVSVSLATSAAQGTGGSGFDTLQNIDNLTGSSFHDTLVGDGNANTLDGLDLNDTINGGDGNDLLIGGLGKDLLTGGAGNDTFDFDALSEMGVTIATRDVITDFVSGQDKIDLSTIDADTDIAGDQIFSVPVVGGSFSGAFANPGDLYFDSVAHILYGNTDTDAEAEFAIKFTGVSALATSDFFL